MSRLRNISFSLLAIVTAVLIAATIVEKYMGTPFVMEHIYGSWWFVALWAVFAAVSLAYIVKMRLHRRPVVFLVHVALAVILLGALITFCTAERGSVHLRQGEAVEVYMSDKGEVKPLPFALTLKAFTIETYPGTDSPMDYKSEIEVRSEKLGVESEVVRCSMNKIAEVQHYRLYQAGYDEDGEGTHLTLSHDPWGIGVTYFGYVMLFVSLLMSFFTKQTRMRQLYKKATRTVASLLVFCLPFTAYGSTANGQYSTVNADLADSIGNLYVLYNQRICPVNTLATDFVTKLSGKAHWNGLSANQVLAGWMFHFEEWENAKLIRIKDKRIQQILGIDNEWASFSDFWNEYNEYKLSSVNSQLSAVNSNKGFREADEKFNLIRMFYSGSLLKLFPYRQNGKIEWLAPGAHNMPADMPQEEWFFIRKALDYLTEAVVMGHTDEAMKTVSSIHRYQLSRASDILPSAGRMKAEVTYNTLSSLRFPVFATLGFGIIFFIIGVIRMVNTKGNRLQTILVTGFNILLFVYVTVLLVLRWIVSDHIPLSNGFEIMQFMAWATLLVTFILQRHFALLLHFSTLLAGLIMLVAMLGESNPQVTSLMPVLQSPLLSIHVVTVMFSYTLFAMCFFLSLTYFIIGIAKPSTLKFQLDTFNSQITALSQLLLYPAVYCLAIGIFMGAIWANQSWGRYWGWDPKEVWALITLFIYALPLHSGSIRWFDAPRHFNIYMLMAFLSMLMTYFGVNFFLGGMHSYAG